MTKTPSIDPRKALDETATSIKELVLELDTGQTAGRRFNAIEIETIASQLQVHVESLLAASKNLRDARAAE